MRLSKIAAILFIAFLLLATALPLQVLAAPGDETTTGSISLVPTIECIGVTVSYSGDNNQNNSTILEYRQSGGSWKTAPEMYADRSRQEHRGSIFWLNANTTYEVRVTFSDPDSVSGTNPRTATTSTRNDNPPIGTNYLYVATNGSDTSGDGSQGNPWRTIQKAANNASPGTTVLVRGGTYSEVIDVNVSGTANNYITFMPYASEQVTITGNHVLQELFNLEDAGYIRIKGFRFEDTLYRQNIGCMIELQQSNCIIEDNVFVNPGGRQAILINYGASKSLIQRNEIIVNTELTNRITGIYWWEAGAANVIRDNTITATTVWLWDGMGGGPENTEGYLNDTDIYNNTIIYADYKTGDPADGWDRDDGIQPEGSSINVRVWNNYIQNSNIGIALCPIMVGPTYVFRNVIHNSFWEEYKLGDGSYGRIYMYHNSFWSSHPADGGKVTNAGLGNIVSKNNIIHAGRYVFEFPSSTQVETMELDYDSLYTTDPTRFIKWPGDSKEDLAELQLDEGQELNGISVPDVRFTDTVNGILTLESNSPCIDAGVILPSFNDADSPWPYQGNNPDMGAYEFGSGPPNNPPVAIDDSYAINEDTTLNVAAPGVLDNDTDADSDPLTAIKTSNPSHGTVTLNSDGSFTYIPSDNYYGSDFFTYRANDGHANSNVTTVSITINPLNDSPAAVNDSYSTGHDTTLNVAAPGVLNNDNDADSDPLTALKLSNPSHGSVTLNSDGSFVYVPDTGYIGSDSFTYKANDGSEDSNTATVNITINGGNNPPVAVDDSYATNKDTTLNVAAPGVLNNDSDPDENPLTAVKLTNPSNGSVTLNSDGSFVYVPDTGYTGGDSFTYQANDGQDNSNVATVSITVSGGDNPPVAVNDSYSTNEDITLNIDGPGVLDNDTDADSDPLTALKLSNPPHGSVTLNSDGSFVYVPDTNYNGSDSFTYQANDGTHNSNTATINITINPVNDAPILASIGNKSVTEGETLEFTISATDPDGDPLTYSAWNLPVGSSFDNSSRVFSWTPVEEQIGKHDGIRFNVRDNHRRSDYERISVIVRAAPENPPPADGGGGGSGGGGGGAGGGGTTSLTGMMTGEGKVVIEVLCTLDDQVVKIILPKNTVVRTRNNANASYIRIKKSDEPVDPGEYCYGITDAYNIEPSGVTFSPPVIMIFRYDPKTIPEGISPDCLHIARYDPDTAEWIDLGGIVNPDTCTITTQIEHLSLYAILAEARPASFEVTDFSVSPKEITAGGTVAVSAVVSNEGNLHGTCEVQLYLDNAVVQTKAVELDGGHSDTVTFMIASDIVGEHRVNIGNISGRFTVTDSTAPASFAVSGLTINPDAVYPGDNIYVTAIVTNDGESAGTYQVALLINDITVQTKEVTLNGGQSTTVSFKVSSDRYGLNQVSIEDLLDSFEVKPIPPPIVTEAAKQPEVTDFSTALYYDEATNKLVYAKIVYQMNQPYNEIPDAIMILSVFLDDELLEEIPLLTFSQLQPDGRTGQLNYIPSGGWQIGEYGFRVELYKGVNLVQETPFKKVIVTPESVTKNVSWWTLGAVIGVAMILVIAFVSVMIYRRRDMLQEEEL